MLRGAAALVAVGRNRTPSGVHSNRTRWARAAASTTQSRTSASPAAHAAAWDASSHSPRAQGLKRVHGVELAAEAPPGEPQPPARHADTTDTQDAVRGLRAAVSAALAGERQVPSWSISGPNASLESFQTAPAATAVLDAIEQRVMHSEDIMHPAIVAAALELMAMDPNVAHVLKTDTRAGIPFAHLAKTLAGDGAPMPAGNLATTIRALTHLRQAAGTDHIALDVLYSSAAGVVHDTSVEVGFSFLLTRLAAQSALSVQTALSQSGPGASRGADVSTSRRLSPLDVWTVVMNGVQHLPVTNLRALLFALKPTLGEVTHALRTVNAEVDNLLFAECNKWQLHGERGVLRAVRTADRDQSPSPAKRALQHQAVVQRWGVDILEVLALAKMGYRLSSVALPLMQALHTSLHAAAPADVWWRCMQSFAHIPGDAQASKLLGTLLDRAGAFMPLPSLLPAAGGTPPSSSAAGGEGVGGSLQSNGRKPFLSTVTRLELPPATEFMVPGPGVRGAPKGARAWKALQPVLPMAAKQPPAAHTLPLQHTLLTPEGAAQLMQAQAAHNGGSMRSRLGVVERLANHVWLNREGASTSTLITALCAVCKLNEGTLAHPAMVLALLEAVGERMANTPASGDAVTPLQVVKLLEAQADVHLVHPAVTEWCLVHLRHHMPKYGILDLSHVVNSLVKQSYPMDAELEHGVMKAVQAQLMQLAPNSMGALELQEEGDVLEDPSGTVEGGAQRSRQGGKGSTLRQLHPQAGDSFTADATTHMFLAHAVVSYTTGALWSICERALQPGVAASDPHVLELLRFVPQALQAVEACIPNDITSAIKRRLPQLESDGWDSGAVLPVALPRGQSSYLGAPVPSGAAVGSDASQRSVSPSAVVVRPSIPMRTVLRHLPLRQLVISPRAWLLLQALRTHCLRLADEAADEEVRAAAEAAVQALPPHLWHTAELVSAAWVASTTHNVQPELHQQLASAYIAAAASGSAPPIQGAADAAATSDGAADGDSSDGAALGVSDADLEEFMRGGRSGDKVRAALVQGVDDDDTGESGSELGDDGGDSESWFSDEEQGGADGAHAGGVYSSGDEGDEWSEGEDAWLPPLEQLLRDLPDELPLKAVAGGPMLGTHEGTPQHLTRIAEVLGSVPGMPPFAPHTLINGIRADFMFPSRRVVLEVHYPVTHCASVRWDELPQLPETLQALKDVQDWRPFNKFFVQLSRRLRAGARRGQAPAAGGGVGIPEVEGVLPEHAAALWNSTERLTDGKVWRSAQGSHEGTIAARRAAALRWMGWQVLTVPQDQLTNPKALPEELHKALFE